MAEQADSIITYEFADRTYQRSAIKSFVGGGHEKHVLWVRGASGNGVTRVLKELIKPTENVEVCYVDLPERDSYSAFLEAIQQHRSKSLADFTRKKFTHSAKRRAATALVVGMGTLGTAALAASGNTSSIPEATRLLGNAATSALTTHSVVSLLEDASTLFRPRGGKTPISSTALAAKYLAAGPKSKTVLVLDNFSRCDEGDAERLCEIMLSLLDEQNTRLRNESSVYCVMATIKEDLDKRADLKRMIAHRIPKTVLNVKPLEKPEHFARMLSNAFDLEGQGEIVEYLFDLCEGNPGRLDEIVSNLYIRHPEVLRHQRLEKRHIVEAVRCNDSTSPSLDLNEFPYPSGLFLRSLGASGIPWPVPLLKLAAETYEAPSGRTNPLSEKAFERAIDTLVPDYCRILCYETIDVLAPKNGETNYLLKRAYERSHDGNFDRWLHGFLIEHTSGFKQAGVSSLLIRRAVSDCSWRSGMHAKKNDLLGYAQACLENNEARKAAKAYEKIDPGDAILSLGHRTLIASVFYDIGDYKKAHRYLGKAKEVIAVKGGIFDTETLRYLCLLAETESVLLSEKHRALGHIDYALSNARNNMDKFLALSVKQKVLTNLGANRLKAKEAFDEAKTFCPDEARDSLPYARLLSTSVEFYRGEQVKKDLEEAWEIAVAHDDVALQGSILTNGAFDLFWQGRIHEAQSLSGRAVDVLSGCRPHEISYPLNNMANCQIMLGDMEEAMRTVERAMLWNKSSYLTYTLENAEMIAAAWSTEEEDEKRTFRIAKKLLKRVSNVRHIDMSIRINVLYNIEQVYKWSNEKPPFEEGAALALAHEQKPEDLPYLWLEGFKEDIEADMKKRLAGQDVSEFMNRRFEPWLVSLTHDRQLD